MDIGYDLMSTVLNFAIVGFATVLWWMIKDIKLAIKEMKTDINHVENMARESEIKIKQHEKFNESIDGKLGVISDHITELKILVGKMIK
jgi:hypothetical protein